MFAVQLLVSFGIYRLVLLLGTPRRRHFSVYKCVCIHARERVQVYAHKECAQGECVHVYVHTRAHKSNILVMQ